MRGIMLRCTVEKQGPTALAVSASGGSLDFFFSPLSSLSFLLLSALGDGSIYLNTVSKSDQTNQQPY